MDKTTTVQAIMTEFAHRTGLSTDAPPQRYLWTDAFAVCNYLELYRLTNKSSYLDTALRLIEQVHAVLGRYSDADSRTGWISALGEQSAKRHPMLGGLRIGKKMNERKVDEPFNESLEWDRDGQYFHYLTKWMHALNRATQVCGDVRFNRWARELAKAAYDSFSYTPSAGGGKRLYWKMSVDLSYPLVSSMGQHDPLDGLITYAQLQTTATDSNTALPENNLDQEISELTVMCEGMNWATDDALGIGGILVDASRIVQLMLHTHLFEPDQLAILMRDAEIGLGMFVRGGHLDHPADHRLGFRELGLSIGMHAIGKMEETLNQHPAAFPKARVLSASLSGFKKYRRLPEVIEQFWLNPAHQQSSTWTDHLDINSVMLATSLAPASYLSPPDLMNTSGLTRPRPCSLLPANK